MAPTVTIDEIKQLIDKLLNATHELAEVHPDGGKKNYYLRVIEGLYRKNYLTFSAIRYLANIPDFADSAMSLCRKMTEDIISLEYMLLMGKEEMAKKFHDFAYIQAEQEMSFHQKLGYPIPKDEQMDKLKAKIEKLKPEFIHAKSGQLQRSWSGKDAEQMWTELAKAKVFDKKDIQRVLLGYTYGSWKSHPNPMDTITFMTNEIRQRTAQGTLKQATILGMMTFIRLTTRYIDEIRAVQQKNVYEDINKAVKEVFGYLDTK